MDSINIPAYFTTPQEFEAAIQRNGYFSIERIEILRGVWGTLPNAHQVAYHIRACMGRVIKQHFKDDIVDKLFDLSRKKLEEMLPSMFKSGKRMTYLFCFNASYNFSICSVEMLVSYS